MIHVKMSCINGCMVKSNLVISLVPFLCHKSQYETEVSRDQILCLTCFFVSLAAKDLVHGAIMMASAQWGKCHVKYKLHLVVVFLANFGL